MFKKRQDEMGRVFLPFAAAGLVLAVAGVIWKHGPMWFLDLVGLWLVLSIGTLLVFLVGLLLFSLTVNMKKPVEENHPRYRKVVLYVLGLLCGVGRVRVHLTGEEKLPEEPFLLVSNHRSGYDPIATGWALRRHDLAFVMKPEILRIPLAGPMIYKANYLPIDRSDPRKAMATIQAASTSMSRDRISIGIYPEGTRSRTGELLPFHNGVFKIAQRANAPVAVVSVRGTEKIFKNLPWRHTDVYIDVLAVLDGADVKKASGAAIGAQVREILGAVLDGEG